MEEFEYVAPAILVEEEDMTGDSFSLCAAHVATA